MGEPAKSEPKGKGKGEDSRFTWKKVIDDGEFIWVRVDADGNSVHTEDLQGEDPLAADLDHDALQEAMGEVLDTENGGLGESRHVEIVDKEGNEFVAQLDADADGDGIADDKQNSVLGYFFGGKANSKEAPAARTNGNSANGQGNGERIAL